MVEVDTTAEGTGPDLMALAAELAAELEDVHASGEGGIVTYDRGATVFARVSADAIEVRLPDDIAEAALRTPDTLPLSGVGWLRFEPQGRERHVTDRASAWFQTAWRHAGAPPEVA